MKQKSLANPEVYISKNTIYDEFAKAEDHQKKIEKFLLPKLKNKIVLDLGCGTGRFSKIFATASKKYFALDISEKQLKLAKRNTKNIKKITFIESTAEKVPLPDHSVDVVFSSWVISVIQGRRNKKRVLKEIKRVLSKNGRVFIIENDSKGEFERIRGHIKRTENGNIWLKKQGFKMKRIKIYFKFKDFETAKEVIRSFYGKAISNKLRSNKIEHNIIVF